MTPRTNFIDKYDKICEVLMQGSEREVLLLSAILRHFLLDKNPLIHQVNREFKIALTFAIPDIDARNALVPRGKIPIPRLCWFGEYEPRMGPCRAVKLAEFLDWRMLLIEGHTYSVRDIIKTCAHTFGGVHSEDPSKDDPKTSLLRFWSDSMRMGDLNIALQTIRGAATYVRDGLRPLYERCHSSIRE